MGDLKIQKKLFSINELTQPKYQKLLRNIVRVRTSKIGYKKKNRVHWVKLGTLFSFLTNLSLRFHAIMQYLLSGWLYASSLGTLGSYSALQYALDKQNLLLRFMGLIKSQFLSRCDQALLVWTLLVVLLGKTYGTIITKCSRSFGV